MFRQNWETVDKIRGVLGAYILVYPGRPVIHANIAGDHPTFTDPGVAFYNAGVALQPGGSIPVEGADLITGGQVRDQFVGNNDGTNIVFDYSVSSLSPHTPGGVTDAMTLTFSDAGWKSYDVTDVAANWFTAVPPLTQQVIRNRLNSSVGVSPSPSGHAPGLLSGIVFAGSTAPYLDHTTLLYLPSPNAAIRHKAGTRFNVESTYNQYIDSVPSYEQTIAPDAVAEHILPNAYYLQFELENTGSTFLAGGRYKQALSLNDQAVPNGPNGEDRRWFWTLPAVFPGAFAAQIRRTTGIENNIGRFYETYSQALAAADNDNLLPNLAETIHKNLMVLYCDRDTLTEDSINLDAIPFYNKITIPTDSWSFGPNTPAMGDPVLRLTSENIYSGPDFISMLQWLAVFHLQDSAAAPTTTDFTVQTRAVTSAGNNPGFINSVTTTPYKSIFPDLDSDINELETGTLAPVMANRISDDIAPFSTAALHRRGLDNTPNSIEINEDITSAANIFNIRANELLRNYQDILTNLPCHTETLMYVVKKYRGDSDTPAQTFYFTNRFDGQDIIFYDSQIKAKQRYRYTFERVMLIFGNEYSYSFPNGATDIDFEYPSMSNSMLLSPPSWADLWIKNLLNIKTCLVPYVAGDVITIVEDRPPVPPDISFHPFHGVNNQIKILLNATTGITNEKPVVILEEDKNFFADEYLAQTGLTATYDNIETIEFRSDDPVDAYTLFKLTTKPSSYRDFEQGARLSVDPEQGIPGAVIDRIRPNTIYYYCARAVDISGNVSNPTHVFEIELVDNAGQIFLRQEIIQFDPTQVEYTKTGQRYIYIEPSMLQLTMLDDTDAHIGTPSTISQPHDTILGASGIDTVWQKTFKIRTTSKKTGKKLDLNLTFKNTGIVNPSE